MTEYTVGCIADLISHGKVKTKKSKKSIFTNNEEQCDLTVENSSKKFKLDRDVTEQTNKQDFNNKKLKKEKHKIKDNESVKKNKVDANTQFTKPKSNINKNENSNEIVHKKKKHKNKVDTQFPKSKSNLNDIENSNEIVHKNKKKHKNKLDANIQFTKSKLNEIESSNEIVHKEKKKHKNKVKFDHSKTNSINGIDESAVAVENSNNSNTEKKLKKKKKKDKSKFKESLEIDKNESISSNLENQNNVPGIKKSKKRKSSFSLNESQDEENVSKPKKKKDALLDLDHVPTDSEEENEKEKAEKPRLNKKVYRHKEFVENTAFVGNIPINYDKSKVQKIFSKYGKVKSVRIRCVPVANINTTKKVAAVKKEFNPMRNSLVAYVKYESPEGVTAALQANGMVIDGHHIRVDAAQEDKKRDINKAVFVGGLPFDIEDDELWEFFEKCGKIKSVRVIRDSQTSIGKGFGYVNFDSTAAVELALKLDGELLKSRVIHVKRCVKSRNKNKMNAFGKAKSKELANELLAKRGKKFKFEKKKEKLQTNSRTTDFQGKQASVKEKKKKKLSKSELQRRKMVKILGGSEK